MTCISLISLSRWKLRGLALINTHTHTLQGVIIHALSLLDEVRATRRQEGRYLTVPTGELSPCSCVCFQASEHDGHLLLKVSVCEADQLKVFVCRLTRLNNLRLLLQRAHRPSEEPQRIQSSSPSAGW